MNRSLKPSALRISVTLAIAAITVACFPGCDRRAEEQGERMLSAQEIAGALAEWGQSDVGPRVAIAFSPTEGQSLALGGVESVDGLYFDCNERLARFATRRDGLLAAVLQENGSPSANLDEVVRLANDLVRRPASDDRVGVWFAIERLHVDRGNGEAVVECVRVHDASGGASGIVVHFRWSGGERAHACSARLWFS